MARDSGFCPACGRGAGAPTLVFETLTDDELASEGVRPEPPARGSRRPVLVGGLVAATVLVGAAIAIGATRDETPAATPATTSPTTTPPPTTTPVPTTAASVASEVAGHGALLGRPVGGTVVALFRRNGKGVVTRLNLDTGKANSEVVSTVRDDGRLLARDGGLVVSDNHSAVVLRPFAYGATSLSQGLDTPPLVTAAAAPDQVWVYDASVEKPQIALYGIGSDDPIRRVDLPARSTPVGSDPDGNVLLQADNGGTFRLDPASGRVSLLTTGRVVAVGRSVVIEDTCNEQLDCAVFARSLATGERERLQAFVGPTLDKVDEFDVPAVLSPDEQHVVAWEQSGAPFPFAMTVLNTTSGAIERRIPMEAPGYQLAAAWTPDGRWVIVKGRDGIEAISVDPSVPDVRVAPPGVDLTGLVSLTVVPAS